MTAVRRVLIGALVLTALHGAAGAAGTRPEPAGIPQRPADAVTGSEFAGRTTGMAGLQRQQAAIGELTRGNLPSHLRRLERVRMDGVAGAEVVLWVMPDYLAIGSDGDFLRIPLTYPSAVAVARKLGFVLPTRKIVDAIYDQAAIRLAPKPLPPGPRMRSSAYYLEHQRLIEAELAGRAGQGLIAGHKKDVVLTNRLRGRRDRIAIYGWHRDEDSPIQPLSTVHGARYADYSHGLRLVWPTAWVNGAPRPVMELLADPEWAPALTYEGELRKPGELMSWPPVP